MRAVQVGNHERKAISYLGGRIIWSRLFAKSHGLQSQLIDNNLHM